MLSKVRPISLSNHLDVKKNITTFNIYSLVVTFFANMKKEIK